MPSLGPVWYNFMSGFTSSFTTSIAKRPALCPALWSASLKTLSHRVNHTVKMQKHNSPLLMKLFSKKTKQFYWWSWAVPNKALVPYPVSSSVGSTWASWKLGLFILRGPLKTKTTSGGPRHVYYQVFLLFLGSTWTNCAVPHILLLSLPRPEGHLQDWNPSMKLQQPYILKKKCSPASKWGLRSHRRSSTEVFLPSKVIIQLFLDFCIVVANIKIYNKKYLMNFLSLIFVILYIIRINFLIKYITLWEIHYIFSNIPYVVFCKLAKFELKIPLVHGEKRPIVLRGKLNQCA
jgi:hypothetical protein